MDDVQELAKWLHGVAHEMSQADIVRNVIGRTSQIIQDGYGRPDDDVLDEEPDESDHIRDVVARFAAQWDECERDLRDERAGA